MQGKRIEIRTPNEHLLVCALVEMNGRYYMEVKSRNKSDHFEVESMIHTLLDYKNRIEIQR